MPTHAEKVPNRGLSGEEVKALLRQDFERLLANHGLLTAYAAYSRVGWVLDLRLIVDAIVMTDGTISQVSRPPSQQERDKRPELAAVDAPLRVAESRSAVVAGDRLTRRVDSPNAERLRAGLPVTVERRQQDGTRLSEQVTYPPDDSQGDGNVTITDATPEARHALGLAPVAPAPPVPFAPRGVEMASIPSEVDPT